ACATACVGAATTLTSSARADGYRPPELGWGYGEIEGARSLAMGGAVRALGMSTSSITANPANLALQRVYHLEALGTYDTGAHELRYGAGVLDSYTSRLAMGVMAAQTNEGIGDAVSRDGLDVHVAIGVPLADKVAFGVAGRYLRVNQTGVGPLNESTPVANAGGDPSNFTGYTFDAGLSFGIGEVLHLAAVGYNLSNPSTSLAPLMVGGGLGVQTPVASIEADMLGVDRSSWGTWKARLQIGGELLAGGKFPLRLGYSWDQSSQRHAISGGVGYIDKQYAMDLGLRQEIAAPSDGWGKATVMTVSLRYFYESATPMGPTDGPGALPQELTPQ
ncbi:MAG: hypothetical protein ACHREM_31625, partial [Polyangiales bacterium]